MTTLRVTLFGPVRLAHDDRPVAEKVPRTAQALLAYLLLHRHRPHSRELLATVLWPELGPEQGRAALSSTLWRLRQVVEPTPALRGAFITALGSDMIGLGPMQGIWLDAAELEDTVTGILAVPDAASDETAARRLGAALALYQGDLLEEFYADWALRERERLRILYLRGHEWLLGYHRSHGQYERALTHGQQILDQDPLREDIHREMMLLYLARGQRALAVRQYQLCCAILDKELAITPLPETRAAHALVIGDKATTMPVAPAASPSMGEFTEAMRRVQQLVGDAQAELQRLLTLVEQLTRGQPDATQ